MRDPSQSPLGFPFPAVPLFLTLPFPFPFPFRFRWNKASSSSFWDGSTTTLLRQSRKKKERSKRRAEWRAPVGQAASHIYCSPSAVTLPPVPLKKQEQDVFFLHIITNTFYAVWMTSEYLQNVSTSSKINLQSFEKNRKILPDGLHVIPADSRVMALWLFLIASTTSRCRGCPPHRVCRVRPHRQHSRTQER